MAQVLDEATQYYYYLHAETGESIWAEEASEVIADGSAAATDEGYDTSAAPALVWEETTDPLSGWTYYYSHANGVSQWAPPAWMDYVDAESGSVYYLHLERLGLAVLHAPNFVGVVLPRVCVYTSNSFEEIQL